MTIARDTIQQDLKIKENYQTTFTDQLEKLEKKHTNSHKKRIMIAIDEKTITKAKELGLNISKICGFLLKRRIELLEKAESGIITKTVPITSQEFISAGSGIPTQIY